MTTKTYLAVLDKYTAIPDPVLGALGSTKFTLFVNPSSVILTPKGCCVGKPVVIPLDKARR